VSKLAENIIKPLLTRANPEMDLKKNILEPIFLGQQSFKNAVLDKKADLFSLVKIVFLHFSLLGISTIDPSNVSSVCQVLVVFYLIYAIFDLFQVHFLKDKESYLNVRNLSVAIILMTSVTALISILLLEVDNTPSVLGSIIVGLYCLLMLVGGLGVRSSIIPNWTHKSFYQNLESRFARFTWTCFFIASFDPASVNGFFPVGWFVIKLAIVEIFFVFINIFIPRLNTSYRWQTIYRLIIPVSLLCVYGAYVGVKYV
jgi:hypothetical protein